MDVTLPDETEQLARELNRWTTKRVERLGEFSGFDHKVWAELVAFGVPGLLGSGGTVVDLAVALMEVARAGLPGPVIEAQLALDTQCTEAAVALERGEVVTSALGHATANSVAVAWGAVADLVVDQRSGAIAARGSLPPMQNEYALPHGWLSGLEAGSFDKHAARRWLLASSAIAGLGRGALERTTAHAVNRHQFSRPLASFQAVQFRLAECLNLLEGLRLSVLDAAWRQSTSRADADVAAALTWLWADRTAARVTEHCHQVYGALGFCTETGLVTLTSQMGWLRASTGRRAAVSIVNVRRLRAPGVPPSRVLAGFDVSPG